MTVQDSFVDAWGKVREANPVVKSSIEAVLGVGKLSVDIVTVDKASDGGVVEADGSLTIKAPEKFLEPRKGWGWAIQLYSARTSRSWGIGEYSDLRDIAKEAMGQGASSILVSPVHAQAVGNHPMASPYSPISRLWLNLIHLSIEEIPMRQFTDLSEIADDVEAVKGHSIIDRELVWATKRRALELIWQEVNGFIPTEGQHWIDKQGEGLRMFALWSVMSEEFGENWQTWKLGFRKAEPRLLENFAAIHKDRVKFWSWCQWLAHKQFLEACSVGVDVIADQAVGFGTDSFDAWYFQSELEFEYEIGCPPDPKNASGQRWGLVPFNPVKLRDSGYKAFIETFHAATREAQAVRIDHVLGLWRLFWIPRNMAETEGVYVTQDVDALLAILRAEASREGKWIVGEDMGTPPEGVRAQMLSINILGYRVALHTEASSWPEMVLGAVETHDQPTVVGVLTGQDLIEMMAVGRGTDVLYADKVRRDLCAKAGLDFERIEKEVTEDDKRQAILAIYKELAQSKARVVLVTPEDASQMIRRPNIPGTIDERPNWRIALPGDIRDIIGTGLGAELAELMRTRHH